jgi:low temperature requirement protein LtrA
VLGLALPASLWWAFFGTGDDDRAEDALKAADPDRRPKLALGAYFYPYVPMLLGIGPSAYRAAAAGLALAAWPVAAWVGAAAGIALLIVVTAAALALEGRAGHATVEA